jgi:orotate phosphoribosyltransferase-like protein
MIGQLEKKVKQSVAALKSHKFDTIAFSGMSGAIIAPAIALAMNKALVLVRKKGDSTHSDYEVEGNCEAKRYVIVDDFIETGKTRDYIKERMSFFAPRSKFIGLLAVSDISERKLEDLGSKQKYPLNE